MEQRKKVVTVIYFYTEKCLIFFQLILKNNLNKKYNKTNNCNKLNIPFNTVLNSTFSCLFRF